MKDAYYFSHDSNARNDEKISMLRAEHGWEGYGIYWALVEMMFENTETSLSLSKIRGIAISCNIDITVLQGIINTCITEELFESDDDIFWSETLRRRKNKYHEIKAKKSAAGKKGMAKRWGTDNTVITDLEEDDNTVITEDNKVKESKGKESKLNEIKEKEIKENIYIPIIEYLNSKANKNYQTSTKKTHSLIDARLNEGFALDDFYKVIDNKVSEWKGNNMDKFLRPETLFGNKFEGYLNEDVKINNKADKPSQKTRFHNFEGRTEGYTSEELESVAERKRREHSEKLKKQKEGLI